MTSPAKPLRAAVYARISKNPRHEAEPIDRQIRKCLDLAGVRDYEVIYDLSVGEGAHWTDNDTSAFEAKEVERPGYRRLLQAIADDEVDVVLTWATDRMLRSVSEMIDFIRIANPANSRLRSEWATIDAVQGGALDLSSPGGRMVAQILASVSQYEVEHKQQRQLLHNEGARALGKPLGGPVPFGWDAVKDDRGKTVAWCENKDEADALREAIRDRIERPEEVSLSTVADRWNELGFRTRRTENDPDGHEWTSNAVRKVLLRPANAGLYSKNDVTADGRRTEKKVILWDVKPTWPALCTVEEWQELVDQAASRSTAPRPRSAALSGIVSCGRCGTKMSGSGHAAKGRLTYACQNKKCGVEISREVVDGAVRTAARDRLLFGDPDELAPSDARVKRAVELRVERAKEVEHLADLEGLWEDRLISVAKYRSDRQATTLNVELLDQKLAAIEEDNAFATMLAETAGDRSFARAADIGKRYDRLPLKTRQSLVRGLFSKIEVVAARGSGRLLRPEERVTLYLPSGAQWTQSDEDEFVTEGDLAPAEG